MEEPVGLVLDYFARWQPALVAELFGALALAVRYELWTAHFGDLEIFPHSAGSWVGSLAAAVAFAICEVSEAVETVEAVEFVELVQPLSSAKAAETAAALEVADMAAGARLALADQHR